MCGSSEVYFNPYSSVRIPTDERFQVDFKARRGPKREQVVFILANRISGEAVFFPRVGRVRIAS